MSRFGPVRFRPLARNDDSGSDNDGCAPPTHYRGSYGDDAVQDDIAAAALDVVSPGTPLFSIIDQSTYQS